jgi:hypothetical protein
MYNCILGGKVLFILWIWRLVDSKIVRRFGKEKTLLPLRRFGSWLVGFYPVDWWLVRLGFLNINFRQNVMFSLHVLYRFWLMLFLAACCHKILLRKLAAETEITAARIWNSGRQQGNHACSSLHTYSIFLYTFYRLCILALCLTFLKAEFGILQK